MDILDRKLKEISPFQKVNTLFHSCRNRGKCGVRLHTVPRYEVLISMNKMPNFLQWFKFLIPLQRNDYPQSIRTVFNHFFSILVTITYCQIQYNFPCPFIMVLVRTEIPSRYSTLLNMSAMLQRV